MYWNGGGDSNALATWEDKRVPCPANRCPFCEMNYIYNRKTLLPPASLELGVDDHGA
jgi:hypothetical protein